ncbi:hypothetical protein [Streptomyces sp. NBC_01750]|uniref:hypothetical protein n=1 Tax=Streptomyces sp. NBC_01750 TaxID=2975928 RepID=UPI002DD8BA8D|nr:hypothetical protein [Streptomyces sp. NBC_01750]WSD38122.1 hypothetical protein OG966_40180 [Streptomyces sp. NBC_01750]
MARNSFPDDLVQVQRDWIRTYEELAHRSPVADTTALRRRLILLSCSLAGHPFWTEAGRPPAARVELRHHARARGWTETA